MRKIYKYVINPNDYVDVEMPSGAQILSWQEQNGQMCVWALVDPSSPVETRRFRWAGTGHDIDELDGHLKFIGTAQQGSFVWHLFEVI